jgi:hypothetical protein
MYTESLETPHPQRAPIYREPLYDTFEADNVACLLDDLRATDPSLYEQTKLAVAVDIAGKVRRSLWFPQKSSTHNDFKKFNLSQPLDLDSLVEKQMTNCYGFTVAASECLDAVGIDHWIGYANGHAFVLIPNQAEEGRDDVFLLDPLSPHLNQQLGSALSWGTPESIRHDIETNERAAVILDSDQMGRTLGRDTDTLVLEHPWLMFAAYNDPLRARRAAYFNADPSTVESRYRGPYRLVTAIFEGTKGREVIENYVAFLVATESGDVASACQSLSELSGCYPELDARQSHRELRSVVKKLCVEDPDAAARVVDEYFGDLASVSGDSRLRERKGDLMRVIAKITGSRAAAQYALRAYQEAAGKPGAYQPIILGKLARARELVEV